MIFVDTSAWFACVAPKDPNHQKAMEWCKNNSETLITTDYIIDETLSLLKARGQIEVAISMGEAFFKNGLSAVHFLTRDEILISLDIFCKYNDKEWSFTDCTSKCIMDRLSIKKAFSFDRHFIQFGSIQVFPD
ncbi:type II toxin-antitoxin system VapC family toxin [Candidatus Sumerlaeota bacterium]|nr:type II toxin-antitoxin system VapC family toxin [Candidatus Sumerlaeota bacterium]